MKKLIIAGLIALSLSGVVQATSGACSGHGGVNCAAGVNYDGRVTCNDGWQNSITLFSDADECNDVVVPVCEYSKEDYLSAKSQLVNLRSQSNPSDSGKLYISNLESNITSCTLSYLYTAVQYCKMLQPDHKVSIINGFPQCACSDVTNRDENGFCKPIVPPPVAQPLQTPFVKQLPLIVETQIINPPNEVVIQKPVKKKICHKGYTLSKKNKCLKIKKSS